MTLTPKIIGMMSCSFLLCLGVSNAASPPDELIIRPSVVPSVIMVTDSIGESTPGKTVKGEVLRVESDNYFFVKQEDGKVVRMHVDNTTANLKKPLKVKPGDFVYAKVDDKGHVISFLSDQPVSH
jgi:translation initiation factor IF-1